MDSEAAAKGLSALRFFAPERAYYLASSIQRAFYYEGKSLSNPTTYREIAIANNLESRGSSGTVRGRGFHQRCPRRLCEGSAAWCPKLPYIAFTKR